MTNKPTNKRKQTNKGNADIKTTTTSISEEKKQKKTKKQKTGLNKKEENKETNKTGLLYTYTGFLTQMSRLYHKLRLCQYKPISFLQF